jgi:hypothetical protein
MTNLRISTVLKEDQYLLVLSEEYKKLEKTKANYKSKEMRISIRGRK